MRTVPIDEVLTSGSLNDRRHEVTIDLIKK